MSDIPPDVLNKFLINQSTYLEEFEKQLSYILNNQDRRYKYFVKDRDGSRIYAEDLYYKLYIVRDADASLDIESGLKKIMSRATLENLSRDPSKFFIEEYAPTIDEYKGFVPGELARIETKAYYQSKLLGLYAPGNILADPVLEEREATIVDIGHMCAFTTNPKYEVIEVSEDDKFELIYKCKQCGAEVHKESW